MIDWSNTVFFKKNYVKLRSLTFFQLKKCLYNIGIDDEIHSPFISVFVSTLGISIEV